MTNKCVVKLLSKISLTIQNLHLYFQDWKEIGDEVILTLANRLRNCTDLKEFDLFLDQTKITDERLRELAIVVSNLKEIVDFELSLNRC